MAERKLIAESEAPLKAIVSGEHGVVYGTPGITMVLQPKTKVSLFEEDGEPCLVMKSVRGEVTLSPDGTVIGEPNPQFSPFVEMAKYLIKQHGFQPKKKLTAEIEAAGSKGMGASASIAAALGACLFYAMGKKIVICHDAEKNELWQAVQVAEEIAHGGRASGIDPMTVVAGPTQLTRLLVGGKPSWKFEKKTVSLPKGTAIIIVDTFTGGKRSSTGEMIKTLAERYGLLQGGAPKTLMQLTPEDKEKLKPFSAVFEKILKNLNPKGNPIALGEAFGENQSLLKNGGVSTERIDEAVRIAKEHGAYGAKLTGAGGEGGAVIVLAPEKESQMLEHIFGQHKFRVFPAKPAKGGTRLTFKGKLIARHRR